MVESVNLSRLVQLYEESRVIADALANLAAGGVITNMTISGGPPNPPPSDEPPSFRLPVSLPTTDLEYPQAMVSSIVAALQMRQDAITDAINSELSGLLTRRS